MTINAPVESRRVVCAVTPELYEDTALLLAERLGCEADYFSDSIRFTRGEWDYCLTTTLIVYRRTERAPDGVRRPLSDLVPVWWEFHTTGPEGEVLNDFSFNELKRYMIP